MDEAKKLRERIANAGVNARGHREYGLELRRDLVAYTRRSIAAGGNATTSAKQLGINPATVIGWLKTEVEVSTALCRVEVDDADEAGVRVRNDGTLVLEIAGGLRVLGLQLEQLVELVRRLR